MKTKFKKDYFFHNANSAIKKIWLKNKFDNKISNIEDRDWGKKL